MPLRPPGVGFKLCRCAIANGELPLERNSVWWGWEIILWGGYRHTSDSSLRRDRECCWWWSWRVRRAVQACALHDGMHSVPRKPWSCKGCRVSAKRRSPTTSVTCRTMRGHLACLPACDSLLSTLCTRAASIQPPACLCTLCTAPPLYSLRGALHHVSSQSTDAMHCDDYTDVGRLTDRW